MNKVFRLVVWAVIMSCILASCQGISVTPPLTCDDLLAIHLQSYIDQSITAETIVKAIEDHHSVSQKHIDVSIHEDGSWFISWIHKGIGYGIQSKNGKTVSRIGIDFTDDTVTTKQILDCVIFPPEWYFAAYGPNPPLKGISYAAELYFPTQGIVAIVTGRDRNRESPPALSPDTPISHLFVGSPGSFPDLFEQRNGHLPEEARPSMRPKLWPGDWGDVRFVEDRGRSW